MTVKELVEKLQEFHPDAIVYLDSNGLSQLDEAFETWDDSDGYVAREARGEVWWEVWLLAENRRK
jgi:hypothetical protein